MVVSYQIMLILTMAKLHGNLLKNSSLSFFDIADIFCHLGGLYDSKMVLVDFFSGDTLSFQRKTTCASALLIGGRAQHRIFEDKKRPC